MQLIVGKGGVGKSTIAAATAIALACKGMRVLVVSLDQAHSLREVFGLPWRPGGADTVSEATEGVEVLELDTLALLEHRLAALSAMVPAGGDHEHGSPLTLPDPEELTGLPGAQELVGLAEVTRLAGSGDWDVVLVDCPATADALRLLTVPELVSDAVERIWPRHRRVMSGAGAAQWQLLAALLVDRLLDSTVPIRALLADGTRTGVRLVVTAQSVAAAEARRTVTALALLGLRLDGVIVNNVLPLYDSQPSGGFEHPVLRWYADRCADQRAAVDGLRDALGDVPVLVGMDCGSEPVGLTPLAALADALFPGASEPLPAGEAAAAPTVVLESGVGVESVYALRLPLPLVDPSTLTVGRVEDDLLIGAAGVRRRVTLASVLRRCVTDSAGFEGGDLVVRFRPDPGVWPT
ncbi:ArsA family ATPase [Rhodococcus spelaei]|uniref:ArsA family ATPase n=1 Tax=Rhodococcus spelaei TaxID=2546320 RepID=A0A541BMK9_9NOCA|nr:ArsA-related P-loop ATPase [Rhodococcus spelaei]TQF73571.1 ArsA family ATPase [Rhodococcus spelaei]